MQIVAEIGVNHNGDIGLGKRLICAAAESGADAVKTQLFVTEKLVTADAQKAGYQQQTTGGGKSQLEMLKQLELSVEQYATLNEYAKSLGVTLFAAPFDIDSVRALGRLGCPIIKIPSGEITNLPYLREVALLGKEIYLSTGMSSMDEVVAAVSIINGQSATPAPGLLTCGAPGPGQAPVDGIAGPERTPAARLTLLHCHTQYPTDFSDANLLAMATMRDMTGLPVGYSDHTPGIEAPVAAVALGAVVIEKHLTIDKTLPGPDHQASLEPGEFARMVRAIRNVERALGDGIKKATLSETENIVIARKSIVAARRIKRGEVISEDMLAAKRPGGGISPMRWHEVIGATAARDFEIDDKIILPSECK